jgi:hypothetical protein
VNVAVADDVHAIYWNPAGLGVKSGNGSLDLAVMSGDLDNTVILSESFKLQ